MPQAPACLSSLRTLRAFLMVAVVVVTYAALVLPLSLRPSAPPLQAGDVAPRDMQAPSQLRVCQPGSDGRGTRQRRKGGPTRLYGAGPGDCPEADR